MAATTTPAEPSSTVKSNLPVFGDGPPRIEGFQPTPLFQGDSFKDRLKRKTMENPFVPIGCLATTGALVFGLRSFQQGNTKQSQMLMRGRIAAQGFTVLALVFGVVITALRHKD